MAEPDVVPTSASIASTGKGIRYIGNWAMAYSGLLQISNTDVTHLDFTSGAGLISGSISMTGPVLATDINNGENILFICYFNDLAIFNVKMNPAGEGMPGDTTIPIIIPPLTRVVVKAKSTATSANYKTSCVMVGRVYGAE